MYGVNDKGQTNRYTETNMPSTWRQAYDTCPEAGQVYVEQLVEGLAAETAIMTGDTACLWNGIVANAMVGMMITGGIPEDKTRKVARDVREIIHAMKHKM